MSELKDETIQKVFMELQAKYFGSQQNIATVKSQLQSTQRERKMAELTRRELDGLPTSTNTYRPVGKMFLQMPLDSMKQQYVQSIEKHDKKIGELERLQKHWERQASDAQGNLNDIMQGPRTM